MGADIDCGDVEVAPEPPMYGFYPVGLRDGVAQVAEKPAREVPLSPIAVHAVIEKLAERIHRPMSVPQLLRQDALLWGNAYLTSDGKRVDPREVVAWRHPDDSVTHRTEDGRTEVRPMLSHTASHPTAEDFLMPRAAQDEFRERIAAAFDVPPELLGAAGTGTYENCAEETKRVGDYLMVKAGEYATEFAARLEGARGWWGRGRHADEYDPREDGPTDHKPRHRLDIDGACSHDYCACLDIRDADDHCPCYRKGARDCCCCGRTPTLR